MYYIKDSLLILCSIAPTQRGHTPWLEVSDAIAVQINK